MWLGATILILIGVAFLLLVCYILYIEIAEPPWYKAQKEKARKLEIRKAKLWETKRRKSSLR